MKLFSAKIKSILVPHAGTLAGDKALSYSIHLAKSSGATINILHVVEPLAKPPVFVFSKKEKKSIEQSLESEMKQIQNDVEKELSDRVKLCKHKGINANYKVVRGTPEDEIVKFVKKYNIDAVVMAKRRKIPGVKGMLHLGSVSRKVLETLRVPVMIVEA